VVVVLGVALMKPLADDFEVCGAAGGGKGWKSDLGVAKRFESYPEGAFFGQLAFFCVINGGPSF
jgi:hypothetical protein